MEWKYVDFFFFFFAPISLVEVFSVCSCCIVITTEIKGEMEHCPLLLWALTQAVD